MINTSSLFSLCKCLICMLLGLLVLQSCSKKHEYHSSLRENSKEVNVMLEEDLYPDESIFFTEYRHLAKPNGLMSKKILVRGETRFFGLYRPDGMPISVATMRSGLDRNKTSYYYDEQGRLIKKEDADGTTKYNYTSEDIRQGTLINYEGDKVNTSTVSFNDEVKQLIISFTNGESLEKKRRYMEDAVIDSTFSQNDLTMIQSYFHGCDGNIERRSIQIFEKDVQVLREDYAYLYTANGFIRKVTYAENRKDLKKTTKTTEYNYKSSGDSLEVTKRSGEAVKYYRYTFDSRGVVVSKEFKNSKGGRYQKVDYVLTYY